VMLFGLINAPTAFMNSMSQVFRLFLDKFIVVFIDGILIYSKIAEDYIRHLRIVLQTIRKHKVYIKLSNVTFGCWK